MEFEIKPEMYSKIVMILMAILTMMFSPFMLHLLKQTDEITKAKFGGSYPAEILQPVTLKMLPSLIDKDTKGVVFVKRGCLNASRDEVEAIRDRNSSDKDVYIVGGHPVKIEVKLCGE